MKVRGWWSGTNVCARKRPYVGTIDRAYRLEHELRPTTQASSCLSPTSSLLRGCTHREHRYVFCSVFSPLWLTGKLPFRVGLDDLPVTMLSIKTSISTFLPTFEASLECTFCLSIHLGRSILDVVCWRH